MKLLGSLASGQPSDSVSYTTPPKYRGFSFIGHVGEQADVWVRSDDGDAVAWVVDNSFNRLAQNDDADSTSLDAHITLKLPANSPETSQKYYIIFTEYSGNAAHFTVEVVVTGSTSGNVFTPVDCRVNSGLPPLAGRWKDDINANELDVTINVLARDSFDQGRLIAKYATPGKACRNPDHQGNRVPFPIDFEGTVSSGGAITGSIYWCNTQTMSGDTFTTGIGRGDISLKESDDGKKLRGSFKGANGTESITFTRLSMPVLPSLRRQAIAQLSAETKIYAEPSIASAVKQTAQAGAKFVIAEITLDTNGGPAWYRVDNGGASAR